MQSIITINLGRFSSNLRPVNVAGPTTTIRKVLNTPGSGVVFEELNRSFLEAAGTSIEAYRSFFVNGMPVEDPDTVLHDGDSLVVGSKTELG